MRFAEGGDLVFLTVLFLHIGGAIVAFGPTFAFPLIGAMGGKEPQHSNFALRLTEHIARRLVVPLVLFQGVTGILLIVLRGWSIFQLWLAVGIVLYVIAVVFSLFYALPAAKRLIEATSAPPPAPPPGAPPSGPPPHVLEMIRGLRRNGMIQAVLIVAIVVLMVYKPTL
jgi:uncharacterized membrane protein